LVHSSLNQEYCPTGKELLSVLNGLNEMDASWDAINGTMCEAITRFARRAMSKNNKNNNKQNSQPISFSDLTKIIGFLPMLSFDSKSFKVKRINETGEFISIFEGFNEQSVTNEMRMRKNSLFELHELILDRFYEFIEKDPSVLLSSSSASIDQLAIYFEFLKILPQRIRTAFLKNRVIPSFPVVVSSSSSSLSLEQSSEEKAALLGRQKSLEKLKSDLFKTFPPPFFRKLNILNDTSFLPGANRLLPVEVALKYRGRLIAFVHRSGEEKLWRGKEFQKLLYYYNHPTVPFFLTGPTRVVPIALVEKIVREQLPPVAARPSVSPHVTFHQRELSQRKRKLIEQESDYFEEDSVASSSLSSSSLPFLPVITTTTTTTADEKTVPRDAVPTTTNWDEIIKEDSWQ
jgi:hypothetical protein